MHAIIRYNQHMPRVLWYHDHKVRLGKAENIVAENFIKDHNTLTPAEAQYHFQRLTARNPEVRKNVVHIFLCFDQYEHIDNGKMANVAADYLAGMRFGEQPWLAYRHYDSLIPHAHLVSTNIREDGTWQKIHLRDLYYSRELTHSLEERYGLNKSQRAGLIQEDALGAIEQIRYGEKPLFPAMKKVLEEVVPHYAYTSLDEFNAVLSLHNMRAGFPERTGLPEKGQENADRGGLYYRPVMADGDPGNTYIKAVAFPSRPTLPALEARFGNNRLSREPSRSQLTTAVDWCLIGSPLSLSAFKEAMSFEGISVVFGHSPEGVLQNCWFVDHNTRAVFEGAALGENYSAQNLAARCIPEDAYRQQQAEQQTQTHRQSLHL